MSNQGEGHSSGVKHFLMRVTKNLGGRGQGLPPLENLLMKTVIVVVIVFRVSACLYPNNTAPLGSTSPPKPHLFFSTLDMATIWPYACIF